MLSLPRRTADPFPWPPRRPPRASSLFRDREVLEEDEDDEDVEDDLGKDDAGGGVMRQGSLSGRLAGNTLSFANPRVHVIRIYSHRPTERACLVRPAPSFVPFLPSFLPVFRHFSLFRAPPLCPSLSFSLSGIASDAFSLLNAPSSPLPPPPRESLAVLFVLRFWRFRATTTTMTTMRDGNVNERHCSLTVTTLPI